MDVNSPNPPKYEAKEIEEDVPDYPQISEVGFILKFLAGATVPTKKRGVCLYYLHKTYNVVFAIYCVVTLLLEITIMKDCFDDLNLLIRDWGVIMTHLMGCVKAYLMYKNEEKLNLFDETLKRENLDYKGDMKVTPLSIIAEGKRLIDSVGYFFALLGVGVGICGYIAYMLKFGQAITDGSFPVNVTCQHLTPFPCYVFYEADTILSCNLFLFFYFIALEIGSFPIVGYFFALLGVGVGICGYIAYMLKCGQAITDGSFPVNVTCQHLTPFPCYVFYEADTILSCNLFLFFYFIALEIGSFPIVGFDIVFAATIITIKANFQIIGAAFNSVRERSLEQLGYSRDLKVFRDEEVPGLNEQMLKEITKATVHFQGVLRLCTEIENIFGLVILFQMAGSLTVTSALLCLTATGDLTPAESVSNIQFYCAMTFELSIFCYFGNELTQAYEELTHSIYNSNWFSASLSYKKHMLMTMCRLQRPVYVTIGKLSPLTLSTLLSVVRASFSVLTMYRSVSE